MYDVAIIGSGPAGVSAAINLKIHNKKIIWFGNADLSKKAEKAELIQNYPGLNEVTGKQFVWALKNHVDQMGLTVTEELVTGVYDMGEYFGLMAKDNTYEAKAVILCLGVEEIKTVKGEENFVGRGVSYCATCDGFLYKGKKIGVLCTDKRYEYEIEYLCSLADTAYVMPIYKGVNVTAPNAKIIMQMPKEVKGGLKLNALIFKDSQIEVDGLFVLKGAISPATLMRGLNVEEGHVVVDRSCKTNIKGVFAAGDCTGRPYQYAKAIGEGNVAAHAVIEYLAKK
ncbi:MAG: FAD-dependent oxidoreductase [Clostridia bacterium]|nr:FAD-dependent oxidoreductase [Clostridia bacterium]